LQSTEVHGVGFAEKIYDVAMGVITTINASSGTVTVPTLLGTTERNAISIDHACNADITVHDLLFRLQALLQAFRGGDHPFNGRLSEVLNGLLGVVG